MSHIAKYGRRRNRGDRRLFLIRNAIEYGTLGKKLNEIIKLYCTRFYVTKISRNFWYREIASRSHLVSNNSSHRSEKSGFMIITVLHCIAYIGRRFIFSSSFGTRSIMIISRIHFDMDHGIS